MTGRILVRHASTAWTGRRYCGRSDPPLAAAGRATAREVAVDLASTVGPDTRLVSSPRRRAVETAEAIATACRIASIDIDERWREVDFGRVEGLTFDALALAEPALADRILAGDTHIDWPDGETARSLTDRVRAALADMPTDVIVVTHAGPIRVALALSLGPHATETGRTEPGSIVRLAAAEGPATDPSRATLPR